MGWMGKVWQGAAHAVLGPLLTAGAAPLQAGPRWAHHGQTHALHCHPLQHCLPITDTHLCCCLPAMQPLIITISLQRHLLAAMLSALQSACSATAPKCVSSSSQRWEVAAQGGGRAGSREGCGGGSAGRRHCRAAALRADGSAAVRPGGASHTPRALPAALSCMHGTGGGHGGCTAPCAAHCHGPSPAALPPLPPPGQAPAPAHRAPAGPARCSTMGSGGRLWEDTQPSAQQPPGSLSLCSGFPPLFPPGSNTPGVPGTGSVWCQGCACTLGCRKWEACCSVSSIPAFQPCPPLLDLVAFGPAQQLGWDGRDALSLHCHLHGPGGIPAGVRGVWEHGDAQHSSAQGWGC